MPLADNMSLPLWAAANSRRAALVVTGLACVVSSTVSAAESPVTVGYESAFEGYRYFETQAPAVEWRQDNDAIEAGSECTAHACGLKDMQAPQEAAPGRTEHAVRETKPQPSPEAVAPRSGSAPPPTMPDDHREHYR